MKVMLVNGSPHENGCTHTALSVLKETLESEGVVAEIFWISNKPLYSCIGCGKCAEKGCCVFEDRVNEFLAVAGDYDGFIFASPVHYAGATGAITFFMSRAFFADLHSGKNRFYLKPAAAVVSAPRAGTTATLDQINKYFLWGHMPIVSSRYWNMVHGNTPEQVMEDKEGIRNLRMLGKNMVLEYMENHPELTDRDQSHVTVNTMSLDALEAHISRLIEEKLRGIELPPHSESIPQEQAEEVSQDIMDMLDDLNLFNM